MIKLSVDVVEVLSKLKKKNDKKILVSDFTFGFWIRSRSNDMENPQLSLA